MMSKQYTSLKAVKDLAREDATFFFELLYEAAVDEGAVQGVVMAWFEYPLNPQDARKVVDTLTDAKWSAFRDPIDREELPYFW